MLQLVQPQIRHGGGFTVIVHRHHAAFVFEFVAALQTAQGLSPQLNAFSSCCLQLGAWSASLLGLSGQVPNTKYQLPPS
jgi:hypothetical protein